MRLSLRAKIVGPFVLIVALVGTIGTAAVTQLVTNEAAAEFNGSLLRGSLLANDHLSLVEAARLTALRGAAAPPPVCPRRPPVMTLPRCSACSCRLSPTPRYQASFCMCSTGRGERSSSSDP